MRRILTGAAAAALLGAAWLALNASGQSTVNGPQPAAGAMAIAKGPGFAVSRAAMINATGSIDAVSDATLTDCVHVDGTGSPCAPAGTVNRGAGYASSRAAVINSLGLIDGAAGTTTWCLHVDGTSTGICVERGAGFAVTRAAIINASGGLDGAAGSPSDCMHVDGSSGACPGGGSSPNFSDDETPAQVDALNYTLAHTPSPAASLQVFVNGLRAERGVDYTITGGSNNTVTFVAYWSALLTAPLAAGTILVVHYRY